MYMYLLQHANATNYSDSTELLIKPTLLSFNSKVSILTFSLKL